MDAETDCVLRGSHVQNPCKQENNSLQTNLLRRRKKRSVIYCHTQKQSHRKTSKPERVVYLCNIYESQGVILQLSIWEAQSVVFSVYVIWENYRLTSNDFELESKLIKNARPSREMNISFLIELRLEQRAFVVRGNKFYFYCKIKETSRKRNIITCQSRFSTNWFIICTNKYDFTFVQKPTDLQQHYVASIFCLFTRSTYKCRSNPEAKPSVTIKQIFAVFALEEERNGSVHRT